MQRVFPKIYINGVIQINPESIIENDDPDFDIKAPDIEFYIPIENRIPKLFWYKKMINWIIKILNTRIW